MSEILLFTSLICPFAQRTRMLLEYSGIKFNMVEVDLNNKPKELLDANPLAKVPTIVHNGESIFESYIVNEYLHDAFLEGTEKSVLPKDLVKRAHMRTWISYFEEMVMPTFYNTLSQPDHREANTTKTIDRLKHFVQYAFKYKGKYIMGDHLSLIDFQIVSFLERWDVISKHYLKFDFTKIDGLQGLAQYYHEIEKHDWFIKSTLPLDTKDFDRSQFLIKGYTKYYKE
jgi:glutathione S-transferase